MFVINFDHYGFYKFVKIEPLFAQRFTRSTGAHLVWMLTVMDSQMTGWFVLDLHYNAISTNEPAF